MMFKKISSIVMFSFLSTSLLAVNANGRIGVGASSATIKGDQANAALTGLALQAGGWMPQLNPTSNWQFGLLVDLNYLSGKNTFKDGFYKYDETLDVNIALMKVMLGYNFHPSFWLGLATSIGGTQVFSNHITRSYETGGFGLLANWDFHKNAAISLGYDYFNPNMEKYGDEESKFILSHAFLTVSYIFSAPDSQKVD